MSSRRSSMPLMSTICADCCGPPATVHCLTACRAVILPMQVVFFAEAWCNTTDHIKWPRLAGIGLSHQMTAGKSVTTLTTWVSKMMRHIVQNTKVMPRSSAMGASSPSSISWSKKHRLQQTTHDMTYDAEVLPKSPAKAESSPRSSSASSSNSSSQSSSNTVCLTA